MSDREIEHRLERLEYTLYRLEKTLDRLVCLLEPPARTYTAPAGFSFAAQPSPGGDVT